MCYARQHALLYLEKRCITPDFRDSLDLGTDHFSHLKLRVEHTANEGGFGEDFVWMADQFELLHYLEGLIAVGYTARPGNSKFW